MKDSYQGYVVYGVQGKKYLPIGIISSDYKRQTISSKIPAKMKSGLIAVEDKRFYNHLGLDYRGIARAVRNNIKKKRIIEGGSTITQQLARNLLFDFDRTMTRKIKESIYSLYLEFRYSKEEILSQYFENVYWGKNIYGLRAASIYYFSKEPYKLSEQEQIMLLTLLRGPNLYGNNISVSFDRYKLLNEILYKNNIIKSTHYYRNISTPPIFQKTELSVLDKELVQYIANNIDTKRGCIVSTINIELQRILNECVKTAPFPVSIVAVEKGKLCAVASTLGSSHPIIFKANVGSTLKPFLYQFLRENGISQDELFCSVRNDLGWNVREVTIPSDQYMTLEQGLLVSNNNVFINAAAKIGINKTLDYLSCKLAIDKKEIYPSTILGATASGISLVDLAILYNNHFLSQKDSYTSELYSILNQNAIHKFGNYFGKNIFLKTGTTNECREHYVILGNRNLVIAAISNKNSSPNDGKGTTLTSHIKKGKKI
ncbi:transglycosylase domain-containing protein, partial [uncultured Alistipes sp.]